MQKRKEPSPMTPDEQQFALDLIESNYRLMLYVIHQHGIRTDDVEDLLQDGIAIICGIAHRLQQMEPRRIQQYIAVIFKNLCLQKRIADRKVPVLSLDSDCLSNELVGISEEQNAVDSDARLDLLELEEQLSERDKLLLWGTYVEGLSTDELAKRLHCTPGSIRTMLSRARQRARKILLREEGGGSSRNG